MGLAASQARLLSITSRMSDNELRSQLINNAKMRLTTDSARVSDEYVAALNKTQLMFTNFDLQGNEAYQPLTFNALTAYSGYNNQYGIVNTAGELLVSTLDAGNFERSGGDLEKFLEQYGLEKTTSYFEKLATSQEFIENGIGYYDMFDQWQNLDVTPEEMQAIYEGEAYQGISHYGEDASLRSIEYGNYEILVEEYQKARDDFRTSIEGSMKNFIGAQKYKNSSGNTITTTVDGTTFLYNGKTFDEYYSQAVSDNPDTRELINAFYGFMNILTAPKETAVGNPITIDENGTKFLVGFDDDNPSKQEFLQILNEQLNIINIYNSGSTTVDYYEYVKGNQMPAYVTFDDDGNKSFITNATQLNDRYIYNDGIDSNNKTIVGYGDGSGDIGITAPAAGDYQKVLYFDSSSYKDYKQLYIKPDGTYTWEGDSNYDNTATPVNIDISSYDGYLTYTKYELTQDDAKEAIDYLYTNFRSGIIANLKKDIFIQSEEVLKAKWEALQKATENLAKFIWGATEGPNISNSMFNDAQYKDFEFYYYLDDPSWVLSSNSAIVDTDNDRRSDTVNKSHYNPWADVETTTAMPDPIAGVDIDGNGRLMDVSYQATKDLFLLDCMLEHYGEPTYTWIDKNNPEENGEAKATWYTNLFNRMQEGYKKLGEGLGSSSEWMQFAFESGLVHMEQVNKSSQWVSTMYTNCSGITESTVDVDITLAEAKYNREMAKIEAKDKQYDIELKNIDTEHESLKQEYESIKKVISKNIDRNYKMFQNA